MQRKRRFLRAIGATLIAATLATLLQVVPAPQQAEAVSASDWDPENIIDDALFYDSKAMTAAEIQAFLDRMIGTCSNGQCLNVLTVTITSRAAVYSQRTGNLVCTAIQGGTYTAAQLIYIAQTACSISAKVILVTLQKEQGLVTHSSPSAYALQRAMGQACPDTAPCNTAALGFANQVLQGTEQLQTYRAGAFARQPGLNFIGWHPNSGCGGTTLNIRNYATAALYNYTPYQPNTAALTNLYGTGDGCSSYGNRNFWRFYNDWFGPTHGGAASSSGDAALMWAVNSAGALSVYSIVNGTWRKPTTVGQGWAGFRHVVGVSDITGDGHRDVLALTASGQLLLYPTDGKGGWLASSTALTGLTSVSSIFSPGDFNGDGRVDLIVVDTAGRMQLHAGAGNGTFAAARTIGWGWSIMNRVFSAGDFNGDGKADVIARDGSGFLWLYLGNGSGSFSGQVRIGNGWGSFNTISSPGDYDGDGNVDVLARNAAGQLTLFRGNGSGSWLGSSLVGQGWAGFLHLSGPGPEAGPVPMQPGVGDLTGDGNRDLLAMTSTGSVVLYPGNGSGGWGTSSTVATGWGDVRLWTSADVDSDGQGELIFATASGELWTRDWNGTAFVNAQRIGTGWGGMNLILSPGDVTGDGRPDLLARDTGGRLWLYPGTSGGAFGAGRQIGTGWGGMTAVFGIGDFNGDGHFDIIGRHGNGQLYLYLGNGTTGFGNSRSIGQGWAALTAVFSAGDVTSDGIPDVLARTSDGRLLLYPGNGAGGWLTSRQVGTGWNMFVRLL